MKYKSRMKGYNILDKITINLEIESKCITGKKPEHPTALIVDDSVLAKTGR